MADTNGNGRATLASLETQVLGIDRNYQDLKRSVDVSLSTLTNRFDAAIDRISNKLEAKTTTNWTPIWAAAGVMVAFLGVIGGALYKPISDNQSDIKSEIRIIAGSIVGRIQYDRDQARHEDLLKGLRADSNATVQQQRYNSDQSKLTESFKDMNEQLQFVRRSFLRADDYEKYQRDVRILIDKNADAIKQIYLRSYVDQGRLSKLEEISKTADSNINVLFDRNYKLATEPPHSK